MAKIKTFDGNLVPAAHGIKNMYGASVADSLLKAHIAKTAAIKATTVSGTTTSWGTLGGLASGGTTTTFVSPSHTPPAGTKPFILKRRMDKVEFHALNTSAKQELVAELAKVVARQLIEEYLGMVEHPDGFIEIGIDIEVRG